MKHSVLMSNEGVQRSGTYSTCFRLNQQYAPSARRNPCGGACCSLRRMEPPQASVEVAVRSGRSMVQIRVSEHMLTSALVVRALHQACEEAFALLIARAALLPFSASPVTRRQYASLARN